eukprot:6692421-Lingulodinium_polyedra.AAC.1
MLNPTAWRAATVGRAGMAIRTKVDTLERKLCHTYANRSSPRGSVVGVEAVVPRVDATPRVADTEGKQVLPQCGGRDD